MNNQAALRQQLQKCMTGSDNTILEDNWDFREKYPACVSPIINQSNFFSTNSFIQKRKPFMQG
jgi:hypothetical protein